MDSAFFNEDIVEALHGAGVEFTISVPFERFPFLKAMIEGRQRWQRLDQEFGFFESQWKPGCWSKRNRFLFIRKRVRLQRKEPIQLDLFVPHAHGYEIKVIATNKRLRTKRVVAFHEGRGAQEGIFAELKSHCQMGHVPVTTTGGQSDLPALGGCSPIT